MNRRWRLVVAALAGGGALAVAPAAFADDSVTPLCNNQACGDGWYTAPVTVIWQISTSPAPNQTIGCNEIPPSAQDLVASTTCEAVWYSNGAVVDDIKRTYTVHVEISNPTAGASLARPPDSNGWYNHPVAVSFGGSAFSGIASCTAPSTYSGPSAANATVTGSCTDNAGKTASASVSFNYDSTPPTITGATASRAPDYNGSYTHPVSYTFNGSDALSGIDHCQTVTYSGPASGRLTGGCWDKAGNYASTPVWVRYIPVVSQSATAARASVSSAPLLLSWKAKRRAAYYNVQIYRSGRKVMSMWPAKTTLLVPRSWRFARHRYQLKPGRYRWYVWPGYGLRRADRYGRIVVAGTFVVKRGS